MSRSYKKPCIKQNMRGTKKAKQTANRWLRRSHQDIGQGNNYKKYYCSWDITDYKWIIWKQFKHSDTWSSTSYNKENEYNEMVKRYSRK